MGTIRPELLTGPMKLRSTGSHLAPQELLQRFVRIGIMPRLFYVDRSLELQHRDRGVGFPGLALSPMIVWYWHQTQSQHEVFARIGEWSHLSKWRIHAKRPALHSSKRSRARALTQSPFDRRWGMGTLSVDTAAAGPANHTISIRLPRRSPLQHEEYQARSFIAQSNRVMPLLSSDPQA